MVRDLRTESRSAGVGRRPRGRGRVGREPIRRLRPRTAWVGPAGLPDRVRRPDLRTRGAVRHQREQRGAAGDRASQCERPVSVPAAPADRRRPGRPGPLAGCGRIVDLEPPRGRRRRSHVLRFDPGDRRSVRAGPSRFRDALGDQPDPEPQRLAGVPPDHAERYRRGPAGGRLDRSARHLAALRPARRDPVRPRGRRGRHHPGAGAARARHRGPDERGPGHALAGYRAQHRPIRGARPLLRRLRRAGGAAREGARPRRVPRTCVSPATACSRPPSP